jgi:PAP2 superfamily
MMSRAAIPARRKGKEMNRQKWVADVATLLVAGPKTALKLQLARAFAVVVVVLSFGISARASDQVLDWISVMNDTVLAGGTSPLVTGRVAAMVSSSVFDAVNGIQPRYHWLLVEPNAPKPASRRAAAIEAAYTMLLKLYPLQMTPLTNARNASLAALTGLESAKSIQNGIDWGDTVVNTIFNIRSADGFTPPPPPFVGVLGLIPPLPTAPPASTIGVWRPTPITAFRTLPAGGNLPGVNPQWASLTPWVLTRPSQFRLPPPYALTSAEYAADYNELKINGTLAGFDPTHPTEHQLVALFWAGNTPLFWNRIAAQVSAERHLTFTQNARLFALLNVAMTDASIACWDSKYRYVFWRPITAIRNGDLDNNPATDPDPNWAPLLDSHPLPAYRGTPAHPENPSAHATFSGAAAFILEDAFGDNTAFTVTSEAASGTRQYSSFSQAIADIADARVFGGIHYRTSCVRGNALGRAVAEYVSTHAFRRRGDDRDDD